MDDLTPLYKPLVEAAFDALVITRAADIVYANPAFAALSGFSMDEIVGSPVLRFVAPECHDLVIERMRNGDGARYQAIGLRKDGSRVPVEIVARNCVYQGAPGRLTAIRDISEAHRAYEELRRWEERFRKVIEAHPDMVSVHRGGKLVYASPRLVEYLGFQELSQLIDRPALSQIHPDDRAQVAERVQRLERGETVPAAILRHVRDDGTTGVVEAMSVPIEYDGKPAILTVLRDVQARRALEQRLIEAEMMAAIGLLAAAVNHEINNPLSYLVMTHEHLARDLDRLCHTWTRQEPDQMAVLLDRLRASARELGEGIERVVTVTRDFKTLTGVHVERGELLDVCSIIPSAVRIAGVELKSRSLVDLVLTPVPLVRANAGRLGQVILNLLVNAAQAPPATGDHVIRVSTSTDHEHVFIDVDDNGPGVPSAIAGRIFEPFFSTKRGQQGSGLGLAIARGLVEGFGGTLDLPPSQLGGACFRIRLPAFRPSDK